ncbi:hypothetical protein C0Q70_06971 [Pomacea canaliculata]|uniref:Uncharacterized protein n=1 Tax=Pomacea canaliculata TaxID=400727 RepID=A0A2T7PDR3_POMCA|nr:hypothetical protein C0Q70_06971 [Pomacea canaliculata]
MQRRNWAAEGLSNIKVACERRNKDERTILFNILPPFNFVPGTAADDRRFILNCTSDGERLKSDCATELGSTSPWHAPCGNATRKLTHTDPYRSGPIDFFPPSPSQQLCGVCLIGDSSSHMSPPTPTPHPTIHCILCSYEQQIYSSTSLLSIKDVNLLSSPPTLHPGTFQCERSKNGA